MDIVFHIENYRALRKVRFQPRPGVLALVGPNGAGKSTLLDLVGLVGKAAVQGYVTAIDSHGGPRSVINLSAPIGTPARIAVELGELLWNATLVSQGSTVVAHEEVLLGKLVCSAVTSPPPATPPAKPRSAHSGLLSGIHTMDTFELKAPGSNGTRPLTFREAHQMDEVREPITATTTFLDLFGHHRYYAVEAIRQHASRAGSDVLLSADGNNIFTVLRNWRDKRAHQPKYDFVVEGLRNAFPETFDSFEFETVGQSVSGNFFMPRQTQSLGFYFAPDGLLVGLLHLAAVASAAHNSLVAIDEFESSLHPFAIRALLEVIEQRCRDESVCLLIATHSPVVLDHFKDAPSRILVMDPRQDVVPIALDQLHDPEWLAHFSLGDLYENNEIAPQTHDA